MVLFADPAEVLEALGQGGEREGLHGLGFWEVDGGEDRGAAGYDGLVILVQGQLLRGVGDLLLLEGFGIA